MTPKIARVIPGRTISEILSDRVQDQLFPPHLELVPQLNELYELELAFYESRILTDGEIVRNGAYFTSVWDVFTRHFLMCSGAPVRLPEHSSSRLRSFFQTNQFKTGYATHGLFPYRGKFHPQMIKGLLNIMGLKPGDTVLDPMMGSGTVLIEASLMGINSVGVDASPFCRFMTQAKIDGLTLPLGPVRAALKDARSVFNYFSSKAGHPRAGNGPLFECQTQNLFAGDIESDLPGASGADGTLADSCKDEQVQSFLLLAYLDAAGYAQRSSRKPPFDQFEAILQRYVFVAEKIQRFLDGSETELGQAKPLLGDARALPVESSSIDGVIFSPPYSFAIDYLENDEFHLGYMRVDLSSLREEMIGLRGSTLRQKYELYKTDMDKVLAECARVLRKGKICTIVVGTNNNQLSKILGVPPEEVTGIDDFLCELGSSHGLKFVRRISRQITGMANTMRTEFIVMLELV